MHSRPKIKFLKERYACDDFFLTHQMGRLWVGLYIRKHEKIADRLRKDGYICIPDYTIGCYLISNKEE